LELKDCKTVPYRFFFPVPGPHLFRYRTGGMVLCHVGSMVICFCFLLQGDAEESLTSPAYDLPQRVRKKRVFIFIVSMQCSVVSVGDP
jgi:hypothetical protein